MRPFRTICGLLLVFALQAASSRAQYDAWPRSGSVFILTTPEGADLPATASVEGFPLLIRFNQDNFDFREAKADGSDLRFTDANGVMLPYQIEAWDSVRGEAVVWVRIPRIRGNSRQELRMFWGKLDATSESSAAAVFGGSNGYIGVWHLGDTVADETATLTSRNVDTTTTRGMIGKGRRLAGGQAISGGEKIADYPEGSAAHTTQAWFRARRANVTIIGWGNEGGGRGSKVRMQLRGPTHVHIDSFFADVDAPLRLPMNEWNHVVYSYANDEGKIYINGRLEGSARQKLEIKSPARLWLGGWYDDFDFEGDLDEVRVSKVARSADWIRLEYENQKPMQTLVGPIVRKGDDFSVSPSRVTVAEGKSTAISAQAGGAQKLYWILKRNNRESVVAVDTTTFRFDAGRVVGDEFASLRFQAVYPREVKEQEIAISIQEKIAEPEFRLTATENWDGRKPIEIVPTIVNLKTIKADGADMLGFDWSVSGPAVVKEIVPGKLVLKRSMGSGTLNVKVAVRNGGAATTRSTSIRVTEPASDAWVKRRPGDYERPHDHQFYARDDDGFGTLVFSGKLAEHAESVFLRVFQGDEPIVNESKRPGADGKYAFSVRIKPGLIKYRVEFGADDHATYAASDIVCGDAYLIVGQSNAVATDFGSDELSPRVNEWVRTFGSTDRGPEGSRLNRWSAAVARGDDGVGAIGYWGVELGRRLVESRRIPICLINGAVGGTRIDQHQRNINDPVDVNTIYGRLLWRVREAGLTHGIRGVIWHQGENDQGADGPSGGFGWETYRDYFHELAASWKSDYPNIQHIYVFQIWPKSCGMGVNGSDNMLREVQRTLPRDFSRMSVMSTLGIRPPGGCHYPAAGYAEFARLLAPLIERDVYGVRFDRRVAPPNLLRAAYSSEKKDEIVLEFDQPVVWTDKLVSEFYLDGAAGLVVGGVVADNRLTLRLGSPVRASKITYLDSASWNQDNLIVGVNGIAATTFCDVTIEPK